MSMFWYSKIIYVKIMSFTIASKVINFPLRCKNVATTKSLTWAAHTGPSLVLIKVNVVVSSFSEGTSSRIMLQGLECGLLVQLSVGRQAWLQASSWIVGALTDSGRDRPEEPWCAGAHQLQTMTSHLTLRMHGMLSAFLWQLIVLFTSWQKNMDLAQIGDPSPRPFQIKVSFR